MDPVHGPQAPQVRHPPALQELEVGEVLFPGTRVVNLVQEDNVDPGEVRGRVLMVLCPMFAEPAVFSTCTDHVGAMFRPPGFEGYTRTSILFMVEGALEQINHIWCAAVNFFLNFNWSVIIIRFNRSSVRCH